MKKVISLILVLVMTVALFCTPAFASPSKSVVFYCDNPDLIFFDNDEVDEEGNFVCYTDEDVQLALDTMTADVEAKLAVATGEEAEALKAQLEILKAAKVEDMMLLFLKNFKTISGKYPVSFNLEFEGADEVNLFMMYRDWDNKDAEPAEGKTVWSMVDAAQGPTVGITEVNKGTVAVFVVAE